LPPPEPTTSRTGEGSASSCSCPSSALTLSFPAMRCRFSTAADGASIRGADSGPLGRSDARRVTGATRSTSWASIASPSHRPRASSPHRAHSVPFRARLALWLRFGGHRDHVAAVTTSDQALSEGVRDGVGAVPQVEPAGHVVDHVLHRPLGQEKLPPHLGGV